MDFLDPVAQPCSMDDFLDFASDIGEEDDQLTSKPPNDLGPTLGLTDPDFPLPEFPEEELEWISNKEAFPALETFVDILSEHPGSLPKQNSPVSVLENSTTSSGGRGGSGFIMSYCRSLQPPVKKARSKRHLKCRRDLQDPRQCWWNQENFKSSRKAASASSNKIGRKCQHCGSEKTPQWRAGPMGPKTLCNACGVRYKSGRLVPEYRPANSPTFSMEKHSNSHRKVLEMRKKKQVMGVVVVKPFEKG
ncbi:GATA transcription factor 1 [Linum perenne]